MLIILDVVLTIILVIIMRKYNYEIGECVAAAMLLFLIFTGILQMSAFLIRVNHQEYITTKEELYSFSDDGNNVYVKRKCKWNNTGNYRYMIKEDGSYKYKELGENEDISVVEGNYSPVLIIHSYDPGTEVKILYGPLSKYVKYDSWYEFYIPTGTFIEYY